MNFDLSDEQRLLQNEIRRFLGDVCTGDSLRDLIRDQASWDRGLWRRIADMGLLGAAIPEAFGGLGYTEMELCLAAEELGRVVAPVPFSSSACLAAEAIRLAGSDAQRQHWLPGLATGELIGTFALDEGPGVSTPGKVQIALDGDRLFGMKSPVPDAMVADLCVVVARVATGTALSVVDLKSPDLVIEPLKGFDLLRSHARLRFNGCQAERLTGSAPPDEAIETLIDRAAVYTAFEQLGGAQAAMYLARDYALERRTFGRQVGSYQAIKHKLADMLVEIELARSNAYFAAWTIANDPGQLRTAAATARLSATAAYEMAARESLHVHGGFGYTWEADCHFHYRRSRLLALSLGSTEYWEGRLIDALVPLATRR